MLQTFRGTIIDCIGDPFFDPIDNCVRYFCDGLLVVENGYVIAVGEYAELSSEYDRIEPIDYRGQFIVPGFIDCHIHFPQTEMMAAYGEQLLTWLSTYTFPTERKFENKAYGVEVADVFLKELIRNGTTTALVYGAVFPQSVDALFEAALEMNLRLIAGKVMMDRHAPEYLCDTARESYRDSKDLIQKWHNKGRLLYAITPRFAVTSSPEQLSLAGRLLQEFPDVYLQTHLSENLAEIDLVKELFPDRAGYLDVYDHCGLVGNRSVFAHCIHLTNDELKRLAETQAAIAFCPTSNLFLGSGLFPLERAKSQKPPIKVGLGTDIGAGTSFSMLQAAKVAYEVAQLQQQKLSPFQALFLATLGGARALNLAHKIGSFNRGQEADFVVLNPRSTPLMAFRNPPLTQLSLTEIADRLFALLIMGDDRAVEATHIMGKRLK